MTTFRIRIDRIIPTELSADSMRRVIEFDVVLDEKERVRLLVHGDTDGIMLDEVQSFSTGASHDDLKLLAVGLDMIADVFDFEFDEDECPEDGDGT